MDFDVAYEYHRAFELPFLATCITVAAVTLWFEYFRGRRRVAVEGKNRNLQIEIAERLQVGNVIEKVIQILESA